VNSLVTELLLVSDLKDARAKELSVYKYLYRLLFATSKGLTIETKKTKRCL
jgi:hypothetical protein